MISIKKFLNSKDSEVEGALRRVIGLLLQAIDLHAVEGDSVDYAHFRSGIQEIAKKLSDETPVEEILVMAGAVAESLRDYSQRTSRYVRANSVEYQNMVSMLTHAVSTVTQTSERSGSRLREIEEQLRRASVIEDIRTLRVRLGQCLEGIQDEIQTQQTEARTVRNELLESVQASHARLKAAAVVDSVTGLADRASAEVALAESANKSGLYAVAIVANRVGAINSRFGIAVGDRVLKRVCDHYRAALGGEDRMFHWHGPSLVALLSRQSTIDDVRNEIARITRSKMEDMIDVGNRSVLLPISASWTVFPMTSSSKVVAGKIDKFIASQAP